MRVKDKTFEVYPITIDADNELEAPEFQVDGENESLINKDLADSNVSEDDKVSVEKPKSRFASLVTAIRIAKWVARANGFTSKNKSLYVSQDKVLE